MPTNVADSTIWRWLHGRPGFSYWSCIAWWIRWVSHAHDESGTGNRNGRRGGRGGTNRKNKKHNILYVMFRFFFLFSVLSVCEKGFMAIQLWSFPMLIKHHELPLLLIHAWWVQTHFHSEVNEREVSSKALWGSLEVLHLSSLQMNLLISNISHIQRTYVY